MEELASKSQKTKTIEKSLNEFEETILLETKRLENVLHQEEFCLSVLTKENENTVKEIKEKELAISHLDKDLESQNKRSAELREYAENLRKTIKMLEGYDMHLSTIIEEKRSRRKSFNDTVKKKLEKYQALWDQYYEFFGTDPQSQKLFNLKNQQEEAERQCQMLDNSIEELQLQIDKKLKQNEENENSWQKQIIKIAEAKCSIIKFEKQIKEKSENMKVLNSELILLDKEIEEKRKNGISEDAEKNDKEQSGISLGMQTLSLEKASMKVQTETQRRDKITNQLPSRTLSFQLPDLKWSLSSSKISSPKPLSIPKSVSKVHQFPIPKFNIVEKAKIATVERIEQSVPVPHTEHISVVSDQRPSETANPDILTSFNCSPVLACNKPKPPDENVQDCSQESSQERHKLVQNTSHMFSVQEETSMEESIAEGFTQTSNFSQCSQDVSFDSERRLQILKQSPDFAYNTKFLFQHGNSQNSPSPTLTKIDENESALTRPVLESRNFLLHFHEGSSPLPPQPSNISQPFELFSMGETTTEQQNQEESFFQFGGWEPTSKPSSSFEFNLFN